MKTPVRMVFLLCLLFGAAPVAAQEYFYRTFTTNDGLPEMQVFDLLCDRQGYIWGCTNNGMFRFNGKSFTTFDIDTVSKVSIVYNMEADADGRVWFTTQDSRVGYIWHDTAYGIPANDALKKMYGSRMVFDLRLNEQQDVWLGTTAVPVKLAHTTNYQAPEPFTAYSDSTHAMLLETGGGLLVSLTETGNNVKTLSWPNSKLLQFYVELKRASGSLRFLVETPEGAAYVPHHRQLRLSTGVILFSYLNQLFIIRPDNSIEKQLLPSRIISMYEDGDHHLWVGMQDSGLYHYARPDPQSEFEHLFRHESVYAVVRDLQEGVWVSGDGLHHIESLYCRKFNSAASFGSGVAGLQVQGDTLLLINRNGSVYFGLPGKMPGIVHRANYSNITRAKVRTCNGKNYLCSAPTGIIFQQKDQLLNPGALSLIKSSRDVIADTNGQLLFIAAAELFLYNESDKQLIKKWKTPVRIRGGAKAPDGRIYLASIEGLFEMKNSQIVPCTTQYHSLGTRIPDVHFDRNGNMFLATQGYGVTIRHAGEWSNITAQEGLISDDITTVFVEESAALPELWLGSSFGFSHVVFTTADLKHFTIRNYPFYDDLAGTPVDYLAFFDHALWVGTPRGLTRMELPAADPVKSIVPVFIRAVKTGLRVLRPDSCLALAHDENSLEFLVDVLDYGNRGKPYFYYQLLGYDKQQRVSIDDKIAYPNLPPGNYTLCIFRTGDRTFRNPVLLPVFIRTPWWQTWWFISAAVAGVVALLWLLISRRFRAIHKREQEKRDLKLQLAELRLRSLRAQMNPHFVFNVINSIQRYVLEKDKHEAYTYLGQFSNLVRRIFHNVGQSDIPLEDELELVQIYVGLEQKRFDRRFEFVLEIDPEIDAGAFHIPGLLLQPLIENAIWHGLMPMREMREGRILLKISTEHHAVRFVVEDNGAGRSAVEPEVSKRRSSGMEIIAERIRIFNKTQHASLQVTDLTDNDGKPCGTRVEFLLDDE